MTGAAPRSPTGSRLLFFAFAAATGAVVGLATLALIALVGFVQEIAFGTGDEWALSVAVAALPPWRVVLAMTLGGLLVGTLLHFVPGRRYHGIADVMEACALNSARMPVRSGVGAALAAGISLGVGAPLGREGPAVHIGASLSAWFAERLALDHKQSLALLGCGAAAAVAVSFNTPIAAVIFALEVIVGYYTLRVFAPIVIAVMLAMVVRELALGSAPLFYVPPHDVDIVRELPLFALLGVAGAVVARTMIAGVEHVERGLRFARVPRWLQPALGGTLIGLVATEVPLVLGIGLEGAALALAGDLTIAVVATLLGAKLLVVAIALGSGFAGGVFGPAVFVGAMLGSAFWWLADLVGLPLVAGAGVYAAVGMAAAGSALLGAPISTVLIVFELTRDYGITLGVMTAAAVASTTMQFGRHASFFRWQLVRRDVNISIGRDLSLLATQRVEALISSGYLVVADTVTCGDLESRMGAGRQRLAMFVDARGGFRGSVNLSGLIGHAIANGLSSPAIEAAEDASYRIGPETNIVSALQTMAERDLEHVPVIEPASSGTRPPPAGVREDPARGGPRRLLGVVQKSDLLAEHYDVIKRARAEEFGIT